jgi:multiple sugar transport system substrate-binding protein
LQTATYKGKLYAAPANSNTQLLWYRKDKVSNPPKTWSDLIGQAVELKTKVEIQGASYEGLTVWFNSLVDSAGGRIVGPGNKPALDQRATEAAGIIAKLAQSPAADPSLSTQKEDQNRLAFEQGNADFQVNYPFIYPSAKTNNPKLFKEIGWAPYPSVSAGGPNRAPIGGFNWGVSNYTKHPTQAFQAATCLRDEQAQRDFAIKGGLPPTLNKLYDDPKFVKDYPFADLIRKQLASPGVRPQTPSYADISLAVYSALSPPEHIQPASVLDKLKSNVADALDSKGLL